MADPVSDRFDPIADLDRAVCSDGAPSARNLLVTVFGDIVLPCGAETETTVQVLTAVLADFGVNERLVRTSLSRLVGDELLVARSHGRRSSYRVAPGALALFADADERIYRGRPQPWDGAWTLVVLDGAEATPEHRATVRAELVATGFGVVAPNVLASPFVPAADASEMLHRVGGVERALITRSPLAEGPAAIDPGDLTRRCFDLDRLGAGYAALADRLATFDDGVLGGLDDGRATKLRLLVVASFRRLVLVDPMLPDALRPPDWPGGLARREAGRVYQAVGSASDRRLSELLGRPIDTVGTRFAQPATT